MFPLILTMLLLAAMPAHAADDALWALLKEGGRVLMLRHAAAPGTYDPSGFKVGAMLKSRGVPIGRVLSSRWCRCLETARFAFGKAEPWPVLDSLRRGGDEARTKER